MQMKLESELPEILKTVLLLLLLLLDKHKYMENCVTMHLGVKVTANKK